MKTCSASIKFNNSKPFSLRSSPKETDESTLTWIIQLYNQSHPQMRVDGSKQTKTLYTILITMTFELYKYE
jgi:hypothetical protein